MGFRNVIVGIIGVFMLLAASAGGARAWSPPQEHHQAHSVAHQGHGRAASATASSGQADALAETASGQDCTAAQHACCPSIAAAPPIVARAVVFDRDSVPPAFTSTLRLTTRVEGIYKPPWLNS